MIKTALILTGERCVDLLRLFRQCNEVDLVGLACPDGNIGWLTAEELKNNYVTADLGNVLALPELKVIVDCSGDPGVRDFLNVNAPKGIRLEELSPHSVLSAVLSSGEHFIETRMLKGELLAVLNSVQDAIEVVDASGQIKYVNPAFTRVTGISDQDRVNRSIFDVSPHGALAQSLIQQKPVTGYRTYVGGSDADVISNASPIIVEGELMGAVVVFQPVGDILKLMDELSHSNAIIDNLYAQLDQLSGGRLSFEALNGCSRAFKAAVESARRASRSDAPVLLSGESGTGKSLFARAMHNESARNKKPLIEFDCSIVPDSRQEIELFGCEKGTMPGILRTRLGKIELAEGSSLFVKEINSLSPYLQDKMRRVLEEQRFFRIGGDMPIKTDARVIASSGENLEQASMRDHFSEDLYRQLGRVRVDLPPLRKRVEDVPLLVEALMNRLNRKLGKKIGSVSPRVLQELVEYDWPGNISELKSIIERAMVVAEGSEIEYHHLSPFIEKRGRPENSGFNEIIPIDKLEQMMLRLALNRYGETLEGKKKAARALNISLATLYNKLKKSTL